MQRAAALRILRFLALATPALIGSGLAATPAGVPTAFASPTANGYTLVQDVNTATFDRMVDFAVIPGTTDQAVVVTEHEARVRRVWLTGAFAPTDYGLLSDRVKVAGDEEGLLSLAFSPNFAGDGRVYVYYTSLTCTAPVTRCSRISRFPVVSNHMVESSETVVLEIEQLPANESNHNGGRLLFGPDGYLYLSIGDGGGAGDPLETGQRNSDLLGSVLRINVTGQNTYTIPADNPFVGLAGDDRVWAYGLRNPWRYSFDRVSGDLWLADVGQAAWEEVEEIVSGGNYGWDCYEGNALYNDPSPGEPCNPPFQFPRAVYDHSLGCSVTGGYIYRGTSLPEIYGWFVYADYCSGRIWAVNPADSSSPVQLVDTNFSIVSFAERPDGELLVLTFSNAIYRLTCAATPDTDGDGQGNACDLDDDNDSFPDSIEDHTGTSVLQSCSTDAIPNNEVVDARPTDLNDDRSVTGADLSAIAGDIGKNVPPAPVRKDFAPDPVGDNAVTAADLSRVAGVIGSSC
jgi:glucose/arabinose dehydrogenase